MKKIIYFLLAYLTLTASGYAPDESAFKTALPIPYSRGSIHTDNQDTHKYLSDYGFLGKVVKYTFTLSENQDITIHHFGSDTENGSQIHLYKLLEPRDPYEYFKDGRIVKIGIANEWMYNINDHEYNAQDNYYQEQRAKAEARYTQYCKENGIPLSGIKKYHPFLFAENLKKGTYFIISEGYARKSNSGYIYMEDGILSTTVMYGNLIPPQATKEETDAGIYSGMFSYKDRAYPRDYKGEGVCHKFQITAPMDILISHNGSAVSDSHIQLKDAQKQLISTSEQSPNPFLPDTVQSYATLYQPQLPADTYYIVSTCNDNEKLIQLSIQGYTEKTDNQELPLSLPSSRKYYLFEITPTVPLTDVSKATLDQSIQTVTYYDGMGRPEQTVHRGASPLKEDLVSYIEYDSYGQESKQWNLIPIGGSGRDYQKEEIEFRGKSFYHDACPHTTPLYEPAPLNRLTEVYQAGKAWRDNARSVKTSQLTNTTENDTLNCMNYTATQSGDTLIRIHCTQNYAPGELSVVRTESEDGAVSFVFTNKLGQTVLSRQILYDSNLRKELLDTYYIYDNFGNLCAILPPSASAQLPQGSFDSHIHEALKQYAYLYQYDNRNRCIAKKIPGCEWIFYLYDRADRVICSQDGNMRQKNEWMFTIPDRFGRECVSGMTHTPFSPFDNPLYNKCVTAVPDEGEGTYKGYQIEGIEPEKPIVYRVNYYDNYRFLGRNGIPDTTYEKVKYEDKEGYGKRYEGECKGMPTGSLSRIVGTDKEEYLYTVVYYDRRGRAIQSKANNHLQGTEKEYMTYDFTGKLMKKMHQHTAEGKKDQTEVYTYTYDHAGRPLTTRHEYNGKTTLLTENEYDRTGKLKTGKRNGNNLLKTEYTYNIRSWISTMINPLFSQRVYYNEVRKDSSNLPGFAGNISAIDWKAGTDKLRGYNFYYDKMARLVKADYREGELANSHFGTAYTYDRMGNLLTLKRNGLVKNETYGEVDILTMEYDGNRLKKVENTGEETGNKETMYFADGIHSDTEYQYDVNGNMTADLNKGISIEYNSMNLPQRICFTKAKNTESRYIYAADGTKLAYIGTDKRIDYVGNIIYEDGKLKRILTEGGYIEDGKYYFYLTDHLGNNRVVADEEGNIVQTTHYYPFGMPFAESSSPDKQPYKYNGKELLTDKGLNLYDYGARHYDATIGRWHTPDPMAEKYANCSPYVYCANNPIRLIDPYGLAWKSTYSIDHHGRKIPNGYEWVPEDESYDEEGFLLPGLYHQAIFFSENNDFTAEKEDYNIGASTATVYLADGTVQNFKATTYPSDTKKFATVPEGIYHASIGIHHGSTEYYTALKMRDKGSKYQTIELKTNNPAYKDGRTYATGIDIHKAGKNNFTGKMKNNKDGVSEGCLLIDIDEWSNFIGLFNTPSQKNNTVSVTVSRTLPEPINVNILPAFNFILNGSRADFFNKNK